jgi:hypothetical protein
MPFAFKNEPSCFVVIPYLTWQIAPGLNQAKASLFYHEGVKTLSTRRTIEAGFKHSLRDPLFRQLADSWQFSPGLNQAKALFYLEDTKAPGSRRGNVLWKQE